MTIAINPKSKYPLQQLVLHESLHAILYLAGLTNVLHDDLEEAVVTAIEHGLAPHVDMNPSIKGKA
jgi:hypothetical protein